MNFSQTMPPLDLDKTVRVGLILNPHTKSNHQHQWDEKARFLLGDDLVFVTHSLDDIPLAIESLFSKQHISVLAISGGDGTIHHTINSLIKYWQFLQEHSSSNDFLQLPPILLLRGGTLNIIARSIGIEGDSKELLRRFLTHFRYSQLRSLPIISQRLICLEKEHHQKYYGCVFGSALTAWSLERYEFQFGGGYLGLVRFLGDILTGFLTQNKLWTENKFMLEKETSVWIDEQYQNSIALVASTIEIKILGGYVTGLKINNHQKMTMRLRILIKQSPKEVISNIYNLFVGKKGKGIIDLESVNSLKINEENNFSFDGEIYHNTTQQILKLSVPQWELPLISDNF